MQIQWSLWDLKSVATWLLKQSSSIFGAFLKILIMCRALYRTSCPKKSWDLITFCRLPKILKQGLCKQMIAQRYNLTYIYIYVIEYSARTPFHLSKSMNQSDCQFINESINSSIIKVSPYPPPLWLLECGSLRTPAAVSKLRASPTKCLWLANW